MKKAVIAAAAGSAVVISGIAVAAPAQATKGDSKKPVTEREYQAIKKGMLKNRTTRILDGKGTRVTKRVREYETYTGDTVRIKYTKPFHKGWNRVQSKQLIEAPEVGPAYLWDQGFETDTQGWSDGGGFGSIDRVDSGTDGITAAEGNHFAMVSRTDSAPYTKFGGFSDQWPGAWTAELDVYLDPSWDAGSGFNYSVAATGTDGDHQRDYIFHVTKDSGTGELLVAGSNNGGQEPREDLDTIANHAVVEQAGWYTLQHNFYEHDGALQVDLNLIDEAGNVLFTETRVAGADDTMDQIGGNRYGWFTGVAVPGGLAVDNNQLYLTPAAS